MDDGLDVAPLQQSSSSTSFAAISTTATDSSSSSDSTSTEATVIPSSDPTLSLPNPALTEEELAGETLTEEDPVSEAGKKYSQISLYDLRHIFCCYWLPRYKSESALKYRFGWKKSDKIHYYSELLGMRDTISEEDLLIDVTKTELEKRISQLERANELLKDKLQFLETSMRSIDVLTADIHGRVKAKAA